MNYIELLNLRTEFEDIIKDFNMGCQVMQGHSASDINTVEWFIEHGHRSNSLRNGFDNAKQIAETIITEHEIWQQKNLHQDHCMNT